MPVSTFLDESQIEVAGALLTLFDGRRDCYGEGEGYCNKEPLTLEVMARHLAGENAIGVYPVTDGNLCFWECIDLDLEGEPDLVQWGKALKLYDSLRRLGCCPFIERSKSKGHHVWVFYREPVEAAWARRVAARAIADAGLPADTEVFPKQDSVDAGGFGNYVNLPYFGPNGNGRRVMLDPTTGTPWTVDEFLDALTLTDPNDVRLPRDGKSEEDGLIVGGDSAARLLAEDAPVGTRHEKAKRVVGLSVARFWQDGQQAALDASLNWNVARCGPPPLPAAEVARMVSDFWKKEAAKRGNADNKEAPPLRFWTGAEIAAQVSPQVEWIAKPWLAAGSVTELTGKLKASGKTTLIMRMIAACLNGGEFLGEQAAGTPVVYLTEERPRTFREHLRRAGLLECESLHVLYYHDTKGMKWPDIVDAAVAECQRVGARLLVVDTLSQFAGLKGEEENQSGSGLEAMEPLLFAAALGLAVLQVRHERKGGGEVGESGRGSTAFAAAADIVLSLKRSEGNAKPNVRVLHALSRFDETPDTLVIELDIEYRALGSKTDVALADAKFAVADILPSTLQGALKDLMTEGKVQRCGEGKRGKPFRYWGSL
ncbi:MAG: AAA family ATPase [Dehalococcoidia bacterium]